MILLSFNDDDNVIPSLLILLVLYLLGVKGAVQRVRDLILSFTSLIDT